MSKTNKIEQYHIDTNMELEHIILFIARLCIDRVTAPTNLISTIKIVLCIDYI